MSQKLKRKLLDDILAINFTMHIRRSKHMLIVRNTNVRLKNRLFVIAQKSDEARPTICK